ncbi:MAG: ComF family protein [bacterium]
MDAAAIPLGVARAASLLLDVVYPPFCLVCDGALPRGEDLVCEACWDEAAGTPSLRTRMLAEGVSAHAVFAPNPTLFSILHAAKYHGRRSLLDRLSGALAEVAGEALPLRAITVFVPVPLHSARARARGYNQSATLAIAAARALGVGCDERLLERRRETRPQAQLPDDARAMNVRGAFRLARHAADFTIPACIAVVDDVVTSGATALECAGLLRAAGAREVHVLSLV